MVVQKLIETQTHMQAGMVGQTRTHTHTLQEAGVRGSSHLFSVNIKQQVQTVAVGTQLKTTVAL